MWLIIFPIATSTEAELEKLDGAEGAARVLGEGFPQSCADVTGGNTIEVPEGGICVNLILDDTKDKTLWTIDTQGDGKHFDIEIPEDEEPTGNGGDNGEDAGNGGDNGEDTGNGGDVDNDGATTEDDDSAMTVAASLAAVL